MKNGVRNRFAAVLLAFGLAAPTVSAAGKNLTFPIPPVKTSILVGKQPIAITASGTITKVSSERGQNVLELELVAHLSDLQSNITAVLASQLDRSDPCGQRIAIQHALLTPLAPSALLVVQLHFESWKCIKVLGKQRPTKLVGGNGTIEMKLTPAIDEGASLRLVPQVRRTEADGALGELLRSGSVGEALRAKVAQTLDSTMQKGTNFKATLPPAVQDYATIENAQFADEGAGKLQVILDGRFQISNQQVQLLANQLKGRSSAPGASER
jgi:hypothetical protein